MHSEQDVHNNGVRARFRLYLQLRRLEPEEADGGKNAQDKVEREPGQIDRGVANEVLDGLLAVRVRVRLLADTLDHLPGDVGDSSEDVSVEAGSFDHEPHHPVSLNRHNRAGAVCRAAENGVSKYHLCVKHCALVDEYR